MKKITFLMTLLLCLVGTSAWANVDWDQYAPETSVTAGKTYVIRSCSNKDFYLRMNPGGFCNNSNDPRGQNAGDAPETYQWILEEQTGGGYALKNVASGTYVSTSVSGYGPASSTTPIEFAVTYDSDLTAFTIKHSSGYLNFSEAYYINFSETAPTAANASTCWVLHELKESVTYVPTKRVSSLVAGRNYMIFNASIINNGGQDISGFIKNSYGVNGVKLEGAKPSKYSSTSKNCLWQVTDNGDGSYKLISVATGKQVNAAGNEVDENVIIVNYENNPKKVWDGVSAWLEDEETKVVSSAIVEEHNLWAIYNEGQTAGWNGNAGGFASDGYFEPYAFYEVKSYTTEQFELEEGVQAALANAGKVGYPQDTEANNTLKAALQNALNADHAAADYWTNLEAAYNDYKVITDVVLPENGKAYKIKAVYGAGATDYLYKNSDGKLQHSEDAAIADKNSMIFVCRKTDDGFVFANYYGSYLAYTNANRGEMPAEYAASALWTVKYPTAPNAGANHSNYVAGDFFGRLELLGNTGHVLLPSKATGNFHNANAPSTWYGVGVNEHSYTFVFEEVDYANLVNFTETAKIGEDYVATFAAPYPAVVPADVEAYAITGKSGEYIALSEPIASGSAIPAGEGVLLVSKSEMSNVVMLPAAGEIAADMTGNLLERATGEAIDAGTTAYILANGNQGIAFYLLIETNRTIAANKAYLASLPAGAVLKLNFGALTGIEGVEAADADAAPVYDLSGRKVLAPVKGGIYVKNGKKYIVK